jgi:hypothetical protein
MPRKAIKKKKKNKTMLKAISTQLGLAAPAGASVRAAATAAFSSFYDITEQTAGGEQLSFAAFKGKVVCEWPPPAPPPFTCGANQPRDSGPLEGKGGGPRSPLLARASESESELCRRR